MSKYEAIDIKKVKTTSIKHRKSKVGVDQLAKPVDPGSRFQDFWESLPSVLARRDLRELILRIVEVHRAEKPVLVMMGAHVIKVGLSPVVVDLLERGVIRGIALNGAGAIHAGPLRPCPT